MNKDVAQDGFSAYEIAVMNGFKGTESEWLESLKGKTIDRPGLSQLEIIFIIKEILGALVGHLRGNPGIDGKDGKDGVNGKDGQDGAKGDKGDKGAKGEKGDKGDKGAKGDDGYTPDHEWDGTRLRFQKPNGEWGDWVDLRGRQGMIIPGGVLPTLNKPNVSISQTLIIGILPAPSDRNYTVAMGLDPSKKYAISSQGYPIALTLSIAENGTDVLVTATNTGATDIPETSVVITAVEV